MRSGRLLAAALAPALAFLFPAHSRGEVLEEIVAKVKG